MCKKKLRGLEPQCPSCKADVRLLVNYVKNLAEGLERAEQATRAGDLDKAVWAYLAVLEVDPDNAIARRQVGSVATAVRQFDETAPGRRWLTKLHRQKRWARWWQNAEETGALTKWLTGALWFGAIIVAFFTGVVAGVQPQRGANGDAPSSSAPVDSRTAPSTDGQPGKSDGAKPPPSPAPAPESRPAPPPAPPSNAERPPGTSKGP
jgi:hypothetical protein